MGEVTGEELRDMRDTVLETVREGFDRTHQRLDVLNGRVGKNEVDTGRHDIRLTVLERRHGVRRSADQASITRRDVTVAVGGGAAIIAALKLLVWIAPALKALTP